MSKTLIVVVVLILAFALVGGIYFLNTQKQVTPVQNTGVNTQQELNPSAENNSSPPEGGSSTTYNIGIKNYAFSPKTITIKVGDTVVWTNQDSVSHTVTSYSGSELDSGGMSNGEAYSHTFTGKGTFNYYCAIHSTMKGKVIVE